MAIAEVAARITDGRYHDEETGFSIAVPIGWRARPGGSGGALRLALSDATSGAIVEIWLFDGSSMQPRRREGCLWTFEDQGRYRPLGAQTEVGVATCMADDVGQPQRFATMVPSKGQTWQIEIVAPVAQLADAKQAGELLLRTLRLPTS